MCGCASAARMSRSRAIRSASDARSHARRGSFKRHRTADHAVGTFREPHGAHPAFANLAQQAIRTDGRATPVERLLERLGGGEIEFRNCVEEGAVVNRRRLSEQREEPRLERRILRRQRSKPLCTLRRREVEDLIQQAAELDPVGGVHGNSGAVDFTAACVGHLRTRLVIDCPQA